MSVYTVNATMTVVCWKMVEVESEDDALEIADQMNAREWEIDIDTGEIEYNITPLIEVES